MEKENNTSVIDLLDLWHIFIWHIIPIVLAAVLGITAMAVYSKYFRVPLYRSTATLYILNQNDTDYSGVSSSDFSLALYLMTGCKDMLKSSVVMEDVIEELDLNMSPAALSAMTTTSSQDGSRILSVSVTSTSPEESKRLVDAICRVGADTIYEIMCLDQVNIIDWGKVNRNPINAIGLRQYIYVGFGAALAVYLFFLLLFLLDDKVKTEEDVHRYLHLSVIGDIPNAESNKHTKNRYGKYRRFANYGRYNRYGGNTKYSYYAYGNNPYSRREGKERGADDE